jgi:protein-S-isoprenylcysteine O-methyltransferase Ste14
MDRIRYDLGVVILILVPLGLLYWLIIHGWAPWWRRRGPIRCYVIVLPMLAALGVLLFQGHGQLLSVNFGTNWSLIGMALVLSGPMTWLELRYWRQLSISTLVGIPELSQQRKGRLLREGIYGVVRHPRYLSAGIGMIANAIIVNYLGVYILLIAVVPLGYLMLVLEERELLGRFGDVYREYQRDVPRLIPRPRRTAEKRPTDC